MFSFFKRIETRKNSIFYSLYKKNDKIIGVAREHYGAHKSLYVELNENFEIVKEEDLEFKAEDPRIFCAAGDIYMTDNFMHCNRVYNFATQKVTNIELDGKNYPFFHHNGRMYAIHTMNPLVICSVDFETGNAERNVVFPLNLEYHQHYRGGTTAYVNPWMNEEDKECVHLFGFGHTTYRESEMKHDIYLWKLRFDEKKENILYEILDIENPPDAKNISDPTSVIEMNGEFYLITAETHCEWFSDQDYITNVYKIDSDVLKNLICSESGWKLADFPANN